MRPVFQDVYFKLPHGPAPTLTLNVINSVNEMENDDLQELVDAFLSVVSVEEKYTAQYRSTVFSHNGEAFDPRLFSRSELQVLEQVANEFKTITAKAISEKSHSEPEYENSEMNSEIQYGLMAPASADFIQFIASEQADLNQAIKITHWKFWFYSALKDVCPDALQQAISRKQVTYVGLLENAIQERLEQTIEDAFTLSPGLIEQLLCREPRS